jgi:phosphomannomutase
MTLIKSISGIRGTIGGKAGGGLTPLDMVKFVSAYSVFIRQSTRLSSNKIVIGRDARISGAMVQHLVAGTLMGMGFDVVDLGLASTPTVELAVTMEGACGGIILTASHNPKQWNALKLLNEKGEFLNAEEGKKILEIAASEAFEYAPVDQLGKYTADTGYNARHIKHVLGLSLVDVDAIKKANFKVAIDCVNSVGGIIIPELLHALGVQVILKLHCAPHGNFAHNPEPLPENLTEISTLIKEAKADVGLVVDPDVDRLAIVCEDGQMFGEEYTLVSVADYVLSHTPGNTVSNLSSTRALRDITQAHGGQYSTAAVGEVNVVEKMRAVDAVIGGEGNGGIIYPASHYGRDALVGIALFLTQLAKSGKRVSELRAGYPAYFIAKQKVELTSDIDVDAVLEAVKKRFSQYDVNTIDGVKIDFPDKWVHLRKSNTEPIIRIYAEAKSMSEAETLGNELIAIIRELS